MHKRIILFSDGTWNSPDQETLNGRKCCTNVVKMALAVAPHDQYGVAQVVCYDKGLGTGRFDRLCGGLFGWGISKNIKELYRFLIEKYRPGDEIYLFGYSRGAYTVRSLAGLIYNCGILQREHASMIDGAYALYRRRDDESKPSELESQLFRKTYAHPDEARRIKCIGVWDTVGALGVPFGNYHPLSRQLSFHDVSLGPHIEHAYHALAIDEKRKPFAPTLWEAKKAHIEDGMQKLDQVWFSGVHADVGGGTADPTTSNIALKWMKERASGCGLALETGVDTPAKPLGKIVESRTGFHALMPAEPRHIWQKPAKGKVKNESLHASVYKRVTLKAEPAYRPINLVPHLERMATGTMVTERHERQVLKEQKRARLQPGFVAGK